MGALRLWARTGSGMPQACVCTISVAEARAQSSAACLQTPVHRRPSMPAAGQKRPGSSQAWQMQALEPGPGYEFLAANCVIHLQETAETLQPGCTTAQIRKVKSKVNLGLSVRRSAIPLHIPSSRQICLRSVAAAFTSTSS